MDLSPQRARTRQAILDAAAAQWCRDPTASLGDVAAVAGVGRATLHRYFSDRHALHTALVSDSWRTLRAMIDEADPTTGSALDVIQRIVTAMVHAGDRVRFLFAATEGTPSEADAGVAQEVDDILLAEIERGQREGTLDATVPARWIELMIWSTVYTGLQAISDGLIPRHGADRLIRRTLRRAVGGSAPQR
ncbi:TetR/AcrR family transcriptional regulator [Streptomyces sp. DSM 44915]|uniref:TetR/AcrR family transcriptional regulator n=1 Tax=Streptomyces chisholmiae TaxID=3075540 RepID=A0ABU2JQQ3_9ACTN|nr:TetR/AcrR family transcriptional regulator [Streptomyces sp. DSM 44915]MDT0267311.1 TetR/AcrR family transcriptional regulator [Streptomyces sp. DSM 44915]